MQKGKKKQCEETKHSSEPNSGVTQKLEISDIEFKITMIIMLRVPM